MSLCSVPANVTIYKQGTYGYYFYVIKKGECNLYINDKFIGVKKIGDVNFSIPIEIKLIFFSGIILLESNSILKLLLIDK